MHQVWRLDHNVNLSAIHGTRNTCRKAGSQLCRFTNRHIELEQQVHISATRLIVNARPKQPYPRVLSRQLGDTRAYCMNLFRGEPHE